MRKLYIFDTTLRDGEQSLGITLNVNEKLEVGHQLVKLGVDIIEAGFPASSPGDLESVQTLAKELKGVVICGLTRAVEQDIDICADSICVHGDNPEAIEFVRRIRAALEEAGASIVSLAQVVS